MSEGFFLFVFYFIFLGGGGRRGRREGFRILSCTKQQTERTWLSILFLLTSNVFADKGTQRPSISSFL